MHSARRFATIPAVVFYEERRVRVLSIGIAVLNLALSADRYFRHAQYHVLDLVGIVSWLTILFTWSAMATTRWIFTDEALVAKRIGARKRVVPYETIASVDPYLVSQPGECIAITLAPPTCKRPKRLIVNPGDRVGFLAQLERHAPQATFRV